MNGLLVKIKVKSKEISKVKINVKENILARRNLAEIFLEIKINSMIYN